jgi:hypothetical protein
MDFQEADQRYVEIKQRHKAGDLTQEEFDKQLKELMVQDEEGRWWVKSRTTGEWHYHDGERWIKDTPPNYESPEAAPQDASAAYPSDWGPPPEPFRITSVLPIIVVIVIIAALFIAVLNLLASGY